LLQDPVLVLKEILSIQQMLWRLNKER